MEREQQKALSALTPADKFRILGEFWRTAWALKAAYLRSLHPDWTDEQVAAEVRRIFIRAA